MTSASRRSPLIRRLRLLRLVAVAVGIGRLSDALSAQDAPADPVVAATQALERRDRERVAAVLPELRMRVQARRDASPALLLVWGRSERFAGNPDSAIAAFAAYEDTQEHPGLGALETARTFLARGFADGAEAWFAAVADADDSTWAAIRADLQPIFTPEEAKAFPSLTTPAERTAWARRFWSERDARDLRDAGERIVEHYRRLDFARANFPLPNRPRQFLPGAGFKSGSTELDDRGIIYVRHGRPSRIARFGSDGPITDITGFSDGLKDYTAPLPPNETWEYASPDGARFFTFLACATFGQRGLGFVPGSCVPPLDYHLVESMLDVFGPGVSRRVASGQGTLNSRDPLFASSIQRAILERAPMGPRFANLLTTDRFALPMFAEQERRESSRDVQVGTTTDGYAHQFDEGLDARIEVLVAGREGRDGLVHVTYALRGGALDATKANDGWVYPVRTRVQVRDARDSVLATADDRRVFRADRPLGRRETVLGRVGVRVPPGSHALRLVIEQDERRGTETGRRTIDVPLVAEGRLQSSDLVLGQETGSVAWVRAADDTVRINPTGTFRSDASVELFQEIYGLPAGTPFRWSLRVEKDRSFFGKLSGGDAVALSLSGEEQATGTVSELRRFLDIGRLAPGKYLIAMKVEAAGRKPVMRERGIVVEAPR